MPCPACNCQLTPAQHTVPGVGQMNRSAENPINCVCTHPAHEHTHLTTDVKETKTLAEPVPTKTPDAGAGSQASAILNQTSPSVGGVVKGPYACGKFITDSKDSKIESPCTLCGYARKEHRTRDCERYMEELAENVRYEENHYKQLICTYPSPSNPKGKCGTLLADHPHRPESLGFEIFNRLFDWAFAPKQAKAAKPTS